jgi:nitrate reductase gamma subunit
MDTDQSLALGIACVGFVCVIACLIYGANRIWGRRYRPVSLSDDIV